MDAGILLGIALIATGSFSAASFAVPFGKTVGWKWETYWMVFSFGSCILFPLIACILFAPDFVSIFRVTPPTTLLAVFVLGAVYGVGNLCFGLGLRYLGLSLGYALSLGLMLAIGTLIPPLIDGRLQIMIQESGGTLLLMGVLVACVGVGLSAWSGILKDRHVSDAKKQESIGEFHLVKGILSAVLVGILGSAMSLGIEQGRPISANALQLGVDPLFTAMPVMLVILSGTMVTVIVWCLYLGFRNKSLKEYVAAASPKALRANYLLCLLAGLLWFSQFILYGMGRSTMGPFTFTSWGILMALSIVFATVWGLIRNEWKGAPTRAYVLMTASLLLLITASFMIGISGSE